MTFDRTQHQSSRELNESKQLSLEPTRPPANIPGYKILKFLGSGAYGEVWSAHDLKTGRKVAIKFYTRGSAATISLLAGEVEKLALLGADRYVVQLLNVGWDADPPYYVMDYIEHGSLEDRLISQQALPAPQAIELFQELATGMMHMHNKGILHCDLKPGNVMLDQEGKPRIADFGQSRLSTGDSPALGTLFYMAPEQADLKALPDARWDVYALGAIFFSMLTGKPPYYCPELAKQIEKSNDIDGRLNRYRDSLEAAPLPTEHRQVPGVDRALADVIDRCIAAHPSRRFENIASILMELRQREIAKARRPLMILGLLGPLFLISLMSIFGWLAFRESVSQTQIKISKKAEEGNNFAAKLAARSAAEQIDEYFRAVTQLSRDPDLQAALEDWLDDPQAQKWSLMLADPNRNSADYEDPAAGDDGIVKVREAFRASPLRVRLQPFLESRLNNSTGDFPVASSWFISDRYGNQIASAFRTVNSTLGKNYAYRSYFTGLPADLPVSEFAPIAPNLSPEEQRRQLNQRTIIEQPHLSAAFRSEQSNSWKLAFSAPVLRDSEVVAIVAVTVDLGNFVDFENQRNQYAMLVDNRPGENRGIILEHPLFEFLLTEHGRLPDDLSHTIIDLNSLPTQSKARSFRDPVGRHSMGREYDRVFIVGKADVARLKSPKMPSTQEKVDTSEEGSSSTRIAESTAKAKTGLVVIALEDYASVVAPASDLIYQWGRLAAIASIFLLTISVGMWFFVRRLLQESREKLNRVFTATQTESDSLKTRDTIPAPGHDQATEIR
jgi:eukaryotic-like serine/threonine-protein kinase